MNYSWKGLNNIWLRDDNPLFFHSPFKSIWECPQNDIHGPLGFFLPLKQAVGVTLVLWIFDNPLFNPILCVMS